MVKGTDLTALEFAEKCGITDSRVRQLLIGGVLNGYKRSSIWFIKDDYKSRVYIRNNEIRRK